MSDGQAALAEARLAGVAAVVSDVLMPGLDGFRLCLAIRQDPRLAGLPFVLTSAAYTEDADLQLAQSVGADAIVTRTPDLGPVIEALLAALAGPRPPRPGPVAELGDEYTYRVVRQLEHQVHLNQVLTARLATVRMEMAILTAATESVRAELPLEGAVDKILQRCLNAAGLSQGGVFRVEASGRIATWPQLGYPEADRAALDAFFGHAELVREVVAQRTPILLPGPGEPSAAIRDLLDRSGARSMLLAPLVLGDEALGAIWLASGRRELEEDWVPFARAIAGQIAQAIGLGRAFARVAEAEARYRGIFENAAEGIYQATAGGRLLLANPALARILGYGSPGELVAAGDDVGRLLCPSPERWAELTRRLDAEGAVSGFETRARRRDGSEVRLSLHVWTVQGEAGEVPHHHHEGLVEDVTEQKRGEDSRQRLSAVLEATSDLVAIADAEQRVIYLNRAGRRLLGLGEAEPLAGSIEGYSPAWVSRLLREEGLPTAIRDGAWQAETALLTRDGREIPVSQVVLAHRGDEGRWTSWPPSPGTSPTASGPRRRSGSRRSWPPWGSSWPGWPTS